MKTKPNPMRARGFTLIEMLVTITIIIILAGLSMGGYSYVIQKQAMSQASIQISLLSKALEEYKLDNGAYPATSNSNVLYTLLYLNGASTTPPGKIYLSELDPKSNKQGWIDLTVPAAPTIIDPWGEQYIYRNGSDVAAKNPDFDLISKGKDTTEGTPDDMRN